MMSRRWAGKRNNNSSSDRPSGILLVVAKSEVAVEEKALRQHFVLQQNMVQIVVQPRPVVAVAVPVRQYEVFRRAGLLPELERSHTSFSDGGTHGGGHVDQSVFRRRAAAQGIDGQAECLAGIGWREVIDTDIPDVWRLGGFVALGYQFLPAAVRAIE